MQVDEIPLSRPKRNIARDFSDGGKLPSVLPMPALSKPPGLTVAALAVLVAEIVQHFHPKLVDLHNYR